MAECSRKDKFLCEVIWKISYIQWFLFSCVIFLHLVLYATFRSWIDDAMSRDTRAFILLAVISDQSSLYSSLIC
jgi:hypothetical protein